MSIRRVLGPRFVFVLAVSVAMSFVGTSVAVGPVTAAKAKPDLSAERADAVIDAARRYVGQPYRLGTEGPGTFDCSGLVFRSFADAGELAQIGGARRLAAGYRRWFESRGFFTTDETQVQRGDLVMYGVGKHIGFYLGDGKVLSALVTGVTIHSLHGISVEVTGFLRVDWSGKRKKSPPEKSPSIGSTDQGSGADIEEPEIEIAPLPALPAGEPGNLGLPSYNTFERFDVGADSLAVNVATGNLVFTHQVVSLPVGNSAFELALTYNSRSIVDSGLGAGWRLNAMRGLTEKQGGDVVFTAGDGSWHTFTAPATTGTITTYDRPATLYASLSRDTSQTPEWTLTYRDGSIDYFAASGSDAMLVTSVDSLGTAIDFSYASRSGLLKAVTDSLGRRAEFSWERGRSQARLVSFSEWLPIDEPAAEPGAWDLHAEQRFRAALGRVIGRVSVERHRFFYDRDGYLIGWGDPLDTVGRCPKTSEHRTCLGYEADRLATIKQLASTTRIKYHAATAEVAELRGSGATEAEGAGATFRRKAADRLRVVRSGPSPSTTVYRLASPADPLGRVGSVARDTGSGMTVEQRTVWDTEQPTEPAQVETPEGTVSYLYVAGSMGVLQMAPEEPTIAGTDGGE